MLLTPLNYFFSLQLVPVFEWERVDAPDGEAPHAPCATTVAPGAGADLPAPPPDTSPSDLRLVFKGYEWRPVAERTVFSREDWESVLRSEADAKEDERDPHRSELARRPTVQPPKPSHDGAAALHPMESSVNKPDTSES